MKNIIFDLGGVVLIEEPISFIKEEDRNKVKIFFEDWYSLDTGKETFLDKYNKCHFSKEIDKEYKDILLNHYKYREINLELIDLINRLKSNNYKVYVLSDNNKETYTYFKNNELFKNIDGWIISYEYESIKIEGKLFDALLNKYNLDSKECYFIDNNINNVKEGNKHGIKGYVFNEKEDISKLYTDMRNNNINI